MDPSSDATPPGDTSSRPSDPALPSQSLADAAHPGLDPRKTDGRDRGRIGRSIGDLDPRRRRIGYFMLVRLVMLTLFTAVAGILAYQHDRDFTALYHGFVWGTLMVGYGLTIVFARLLPRVRDLDRFAWFQTTTDIMLAAVVVQVSGGTDSGFVSLYLIAVLGAATMAGRRETWAAAGACTLIYGTMTLLEGMGVIEPMSLGQPLQALPPRELALAFGRTLAGLVGVTVLSSFLNTQLASSTTQVGNLRAMNDNIVRSLPSGIIGVDNERRVLYINPAAREILGVDDADLRRPVIELLPGVEDVLEPPSTASIPSRLPPAAQALVRAELQVKTRSGARLHLSVRGSPLRDGQGRRLGQLVYFEDVTRVHELAEQVRRSERLAAVGGLAASVAHEIRNPLAAISGSAELLDASGLPEDDNRLLSIIRRESARLSELITDMLAFTRPRTPQRQRVTLEQIARETVETFRNDPQTGDLEVELVRPQALPTVEVDPAQISQVLWNLLRNAAEAIGTQGERRGRIEVALRWREDDDEVELSVSDDGPGIEDEQLDRIFDPFFTTKERGTGFGLATVHRIVQDNGGAIELSSTVGEGTSFRLRFAAVRD